MELYLRWLEKNETEPDEGMPIGLTLCAESNTEQIELLQLDETNIKVGQYINVVKCYCFEIHHQQKRTKVSIRRTLSCRKSKDLRP